MFELPAWITMAIAATRLHRSLVGLASDTTHVYDDVHYSPLIVRLTLSIQL